MLKESGKLIIAVPNHSSYDALHYREFWAAWDVPRHIWHFAPKHMKILGKKHCFYLSGVYTMPFDSFHVSLIDPFRAQAIAKKSKMKLFNAFFHGSISWITSVFKPGKCSSVIYVYEKN